MTASQDIIGIVLAAGKGSRFKSNGTNKTASLFKNKPLLQFGIDLYKHFCSNVVVVIGAYADSVISAISHNDNILFAHQTKRLGTGHALMIGVKEIEKNNLSPKYVLLGYGDHMMHYTPNIVKRMIASLRENPQTVITLVTTTVEDPIALAWGRIIRNGEGNVVGIVEQKDATDEQKMIREVNAGFYCFDYPFLKKYGKKIKKSPVTGEYYITDILEIAVKEHFTIKPIIVPFEKVGLGINTREDLQKSEALSHLTS